MSPQEFTSSAAGSVVKNFQGHWAFIPNALPPTDIPWHQALIDVVTTAERTLGRLAGLGERLRNPQPLIRFFLRREAELSSRIEGTQAGVQTMVLFEHLPAVEKEQPDVREVRNNFAALEHGLESLAHRPLTLALIKEMHQVLMEGVRGQDKTPGMFRNIQVHIGRSGDINSARFVPPPPHEVEPCMADLERYINRTDSLPSVVRAAIIHYQFEAIHPFADGNGRIGRVIMLLFFCRQGVLPMPLFNPSAYLERHRSAYYDHLLNVSRRGEWDDWIAFFARGVTEEANDAISRLQRLESLREDYHQRVRTPRASALLPALIDHLFADPAITVNGVASRLQIGYTSAQKLVEKLLRSRIIHRVAGSERNRVYLAHEVIDLFDEHA